MTVRLSDAGCARLAIDEARRRLHEEAQEITAQQRAAFDAVFRCSRLHEVVLQKMIALESAEERLKCPH